MRRDHRAYSMTFWAVFIGFVLIPSLALAIELGRYFYAISEVAKVADAAAVAASAEINKRTFRDSDSLVPPGKHGRMPNPMLGKTQLAWRRRAYRPMLLISR